MKSVSLILRIVAIVGAVACVALWFHSQGIIKQATSDMAGIQAPTLVGKSAQVPGILAEKAQMATELAAAKTKISNLDNQIKEINANLESAKTASVKANRDLVKAQTDLRSAKVQLEDSTKLVADKDNMIAALRKEIERSAGGNSDDSAKIDALNAKYNTLSNNFAALQLQFEEAKKKADILDIAIVVEEKEIDLDKGVERTTTRYFAPYVAQGDIATVTIVEGREDLIALNRGKSAGLGERQLIDLKNKTGELIAQVTIVEIGPDFAIASVNPKLGKPETLENGDMLELVKTVDLKPAEAAEAPAVAPVAAEAEEE